MDFAFFIRIKKGEYPLNSEEKMAKNNDDIITLVTEEEAPKKRVKKKVAETPAAPNNDAFRGNSNTGVKHFEAKGGDENSAFSPKNATENDSSINFYSEDDGDKRPPITDYTSVSAEETSLSELYSDSGKTVCMVMRVISTVLFMLSPLYFIGQLFALFGSNQPLTSGQMISGVISALVTAILFVIGGFLVIALIKILQNLMALQKKK